MKSENLSKSELDVMAVLWRLGRATVSEVQGELARSRPDDKAFAYTTVATHLNRMLEKGAVTATKTGRSLVFEPTEDRSDFRQSRLSALVRQFFDGRPSSLASQFIEQNSFTTEELDELRRLIDEKKRS
ncbi:BlaI/MecI/CopY family transcriptional regulator [Labrenzia sp. PHM005]|uniref:BlaI/MecI/CopY family transcriptional regulator n=1 Tax=Labrenzia sp. PHM005 TaxID=2590016 RepID=UPI0011402341|nr:BlaI/MecI/CopY family transcriptional regulator [Labrenzia sp. PHM005]QDG78632.1 BlaI/MecI/CopY family transcriptional regulator [Labrenzia sp. PHM005]